MSSFPTVFNYDGQEIRTIIKDGEPWFVAKDVCEILGLEQVSRAMDRLDEEERGLLKITHPQSPEKLIEVNAVNEPGLYQLIFASSKQEAKTFKRWVTHDVLPEIRKTGQYGGRKIPGTFKEALIELVKAIEENEKLQPKAEMYDILLSGDNCQTMAQVAKSFGWGRNKLFAYLRDKNVLMKNNLPYQRYIDSDYFEVREVSTFRGDKTINVTQTMVTAKGIDFIGKILNPETSLAIH